MAEQTRVIKIIVDAEGAKSQVDAFAASMGRLEKVVFAGTAGLWLLDKALSVVSSSFETIVKKPALLAARFETLGVVMERIGRNAGYSAAEVTKYAQEVQKSGITMNESRQGVIRLMQAHVDLTNAQKLARIAQDAAVIGQLNSSEAFERLVHGMTTAQTEVLHAIGISVNFEKAYRDIAKTLDKTMDNLTEAEKSQARLNVVLEAGERIAGAYEAAMGTAGKQLTSMARYHEDLATTMGQVWTDTLTIVVMQYVEQLKQATENSNRLEKEGSLKQWGRDVTTVVAFAMDSLRLLVNLVMEVVDEFKILGSGMGALAANIGILKNAVVGDTKWSDVLPQMKEVIAAATEYEQSILKANNARWNAKSYGQIAEEFWNKSDAAAAAKSARDNDPSTIAKIKADAAKADALKAQQEAQGAVEDLLKNYRTDNERLNAEIAKFKTLAKQAGMSQAEINKGISKIRAKFAGKNGDAEENRAIRALRDTAGDNVKLQAQIEHMREYGIALNETNKLGMTYEVTHGRYSKNVDAGTKALLVSTAATKDRLEAEKAFIQESIRWADSHNEKLAQMDNELELLKANTQEREILQIQQELELDYLERIKGKTPEQIELIRQQTDQYEQLAIAKTKVRQTFERSAEYGAQQAFQNYADSATNAAQQIEQALTNAFSKVEDAMVQTFMMGKFSFRDMANSIIQDLIRISVRQGITGPLADFMGKGGGGISSWIGSAFGSLFGARALGGTVAAGQPYIVGERQPELFVPDVPGRIIPQVEMGGGSQVNHVSIQINQQTGETDTKTSGENAVELGRRIELAVKRVMLEERRNGGMYAPA